MDQTESTANTSASVRMTESLGYAPIGKLIARFAGPGVISMLVMSLYNVVDQLFIGHGVGFLGNAATNVVFPVTIFTLAVSMLIGEGAVAVYSIRLGEGNREGAKQCIGTATVLLSITGVAVAVLCFIFLQPMLVFFGATEEALPYAIEYAGPIVFGIPFVFVGPGLNAFIRAKGAPRYAMNSMIVGAVLNTILDPIFIWPLGMGVAGAAIATAISQFASFAFTLAFYLRGEGFGLERRHFRVRWPVAKTILTCGIPPCFSQMAIMVVIVSVNNALVKHGSASVYGPNIPLAAHGIAMKVNQIMFAFLLGVSMGTQPIIGYNYGARNFGRVKQTFKTAAVLVTAVGVAGFVLFVFFPQAIVSLFGHEDELYNDYARKSFRIFLFFAPLNGITVLSGTFFQSMAKAGKAAVIQLSRQVLFMIPAVNILPRFLGIEGVLLSGPVSDGLAFVLASALVVSELRRIDREEIQNV